LGDLKVAMDGPTEIGETPLEHPPYSPELGLLAFQTKVKTACSTIFLKLAANGPQHVSRSGWSVVRSSSPAKGDISKKRPSLHPHKVPTRSNKVSPRTLQTALVHTKFWSENTKGRDHSEYLSVDGKIILEGMLRKYGYKLWTGFMWLRLGPIGGLL
jgi:hypothetical protein